MYWTIAIESQKLFPSLDYTISFHVGVTTRMMSQPDPGVPEAEGTLLPPAWRRWEQEAEELQEADEAEEFQSVGMRCRECLVAMVKSLADHEKREAVQILLPHPLLYRVPSQGSGARQATGEGAGGPCRSKS
jgi:hypothetical protein